MHSLEPRPEAGSARSRLFVYNSGFLTQRRLRRILDLAGYDIRLGRPGKDNLVGIWGNSPTAHRGRAAAERYGTGLLRVEDAFLRSLHTGRAGEPPLGLLLDQQGVHFDPAQPSGLEQLLVQNPLDDAALLSRARDAIARMKEQHLSKYNAFDPAAAVPDAGYVLVIDQTRGDASVAASGADRARFLEMLYWAQEENPGARILIKTHPETAQGFRQGHFKAEDATGRISLFDAAVSPWALLEGAVAVYTVSSQMGFEAILAGHKPRLFGQPFYASWGLSQDEFPLTRRQRRLTRAQLAAGALFHYPVWYDPFRDELCSFETVLDVLEAKARAWREDHRGWSAAGMRLWKRRPLQRFFGQHKRMVFSETLPKDGRRAMIWAGKAQEGSAAVRVEDGFLRSRGLGAELVPPLSLVADTSGIYYDPGLPSDLEGWIAKRAALSPAQERRASALIRQVTGAGLSKYNLGGARPDLPVGRRILVPGQVEDDASIRKGAGKVRTNLGLLRAARDANPEAVILYKPHPDVEADLRPGAIPAAEAAALADLVLEKIDTAALLDMVDEVWTMTSLTGFEALLRGVRVVTLGAPFYAGWGLTTDLGAIPARRQARVPLEGLVHAALIDYPRYFDPLTGAPCPAEIAAKRLAEGSPPNRSPANRALSKLQGLLAGGTHWWR